MGDHNHMAKGLPQLGSSLFRVLYGTDLCWGVLLELVVLISPLTNVRLGKVNVLMLMGVFFW